MEVHVMLNFVYLDFCFDFWYPVVLCKKKFQLKNNKDFCTDSSKLTICQLEFHYVAKRKASNKGRSKPVGGLSLVRKRGDERIILKRTLGKYCDG
jgi:hypothetical protein